MVPPKSTAVKICGIKKANQAITIARMGVYAIGIIGVKESPRFLNDKDRRKLFIELKKFSAKTERVWVIADLDDSEIYKGLSGEGTPTIVQLHGNESKSRCEELRKAYPAIKWWKGLQIKEEKDINTAKSYSDNVDALLLDAWSPKKLGGTGARLPLNFLEKVSFDVPWWLAGGVSAEWIPELMRAINPFGIDASSKLESSPGIKDLNKVENLIKAINTREVN